MTTTNETRLKWMVYDHDFQRSKRVAMILFTRCGIKALVYEEAIKTLNVSGAAATLLVHCEALHQSFIQLAMLKQTGKYDFRFYCTEEKDRIPQVPYLPDEWERLVS